MAIISNKTNRFITINHRQGNPVGDEIESLRANSIKIILTPNACTEVAEDLFAEIKNHEWIKSLVDNDFIEIDNSSSIEKVVAKMEKSILKKGGELPERGELPDSNIEDEEAIEKPSRRGRPAKNDPELVL